LPALVTHNSMASDPLRQVKRTPPGELMHHPHLIRRAALALTALLAAGACRTRLLDEEELAGATGDAAIGGPADAARSPACSGGDEEPEWALPGHDATGRARAPFSGPVRLDVAWRSDRFDGRRSQIAVASDGSVLVATRDALRVLDPASGVLRAAI